MRTGIYYISLGLVAATSALAGDIDCHDKCYGIEGQEVQEDHYNQCIADCLAERDQPGGPINDQASVTKSDVDYDFLQKRSTSFYATASSHAEFLTFPNTDDDAEAQRIKRNDAVIATEAASNIVSERSEATSLTQINEEPFDRNDEGSTMQKRSDLHMATEAVAFLLGSEVAVLPRDTVDTALPQATDISPALAIRASKPSHCSHLSGPEYHKTSDEQEYWIMTGEEGQKVAENSGTIASVTAFAFIATLLAACALL